MLGDLITIGVVTIILVAFILGQAGPAPFHIAYWLGYRKGSNAGRNEATPKRDSRGRFLPPELPDGVRRDKEKA